MLSAKISYLNRNDKINYINECEQAFDKEVEFAIEQLLGHERLKFIYVCGPSCSGKTTASDMLISGLSGKGRQIEIISVDDYYKNREVIIRECEERNVPTDFESISAIDFPLFEKTLMLLDSNTDSISIPVFDFKTGKRCGYRTIKNTKDTLILFEGIQTVYPEITALFDTFETDGVRIGVFEDIAAGNNILSMTDARLLRRIVRDVYKRNTSPADTLKLWDSVRSNEIKSIDPYIGNVKIKINSFLGYEISAMRNRALELFKTVPESDIKHTKIAELKRIISPANEIESNLIPDKSIIREFLI